MITAVFIMVDDVNEIQEILEDNNIDFEVWYDLCESNEVRISIEKLDKNNKEKLKNIINEYQRNLENNINIEKFSYIIFWS